MTMDKVKGKAKEAMGEGKERAGRATGDEDLEAEGTGDKAEGKTQEVMGKGKEALDKAKDKVT